MGRPQGRRAGDTSSWRRRSRNSAPFRQQHRRPRPASRPPFAKLGEIGPAAAGAIPILELVEEDDPIKAVPAAAAEALAKIQGR